MLLLLGTRFATAVLLLTVLEIALGAKGEAIAIDQDKNGNDGDNGPYPQLVAMTSGPGWFIDHLAEPDYYEDDSDNPDDIMNDGYDVGPSNPNEMPPATDTMLEKRYLGSLARQGHHAATRIHRFYTRSEPESGDLSSDGSWSEDPQPDATYEHKRHLGTLARDKWLRNLGQASIVTRQPWSEATQAPSWNQKPKRAEAPDGEETSVVDTGDTDSYDSDDGSKQDAEDMPLATVVKRNIAALARAGGFSQLRAQRRPVPWVSKNSDSDSDYDTIRSNDGYKRNIQGLGRIASPGTRFRSWLRSRLPPSRSMQEDKRKLVLPNLQYGRHSYGTRDRGRGIRSALDRFRAASPSYVLGHSRHHFFRAPMAFVSRHMIKRAALPWKLPTAF